MRAGATMPPNFGVTPTGFVAPTEQQLLDLMVADQKAMVSAKADTAPGSVLGQINAIVVRQLMKGYADLERVYNSNDPDVVDGFMLTQLGKLTGTSRRGATSSTVVLGCDLEAGTVLPAGVALAAGVGSTWTPIQDFTAPSSSYFEILFECTKTGAIAAPAGQIVNRLTTIPGWLTVHNYADADVGFDIEPDQAFRVRREVETESGGAGNADAILAALLLVGGSKGPFIQSATVLNNVTDVYDANGLPPHSTEAIIWDGPTAPVASKTIAQVLWDEGAAGIRTFGTTSGTANDALGNPQTVYFSRVTQVPVYIGIRIQRLSAYVGDAAFKAALVAACAGKPSRSSESESFSVGESVNPYDVMLNAAGLGAKVTGLKLALTAPYLITTFDPTEVSIGRHEIATFDTGRVVLEYP